MPRAAWNWGSDSNVTNDTFGAAPLHIYAFHSYRALWVVTVCSPAFVEHKWNTRNKREMAVVIQRSSPVQSLHLKVDSSQQGASSSGIPPWGADSISQPGESEKTTGGRGSPVVRNLPLLFIEVTYLGASSSGIPPHGASGSSKPVVWNWELAALAYHRQLAVPTNLWTKVTYNM
jgi:hypothetical protein